MTESEAIEIGARAIWWEFVKVVHPKWLKDEKRKETFAEAVERRWAETMPAVQEAYRREATACLKAVGVIR